MLVVLEDVLLHVLAKFVSPKDLTSLCTTSSNHTKSLAALVKKNRWKKVVKRLSHKIRGHRVPGKCALCCQDTPQLVDVTFMHNVAKVYEAGFFCVNHWPRMLGTQFLPTVWCPHNKRNWHEINTFSAETML